LKSSAFELQENEILVTSDTIVTRQLGKPNDKQDAFTILKSLSLTKLLRPFALKLFKNRFVV
jgi:predicted house-cleaning NTP pyrophosphatase (Maf/HAM1 superfamily)